MLNESNFFSDTKRELEDYVQNRILLLKMQVSGKIAGMVAKILLIILMGLIAITFVFFLSIMAGYYFSSITNSLSIGFGIVAGIYCLFAILVYLTRKKMYNFIANIVIQILLKNDE